MPNKTPPALPALVTLNRAAAMLGCSRSTVRRLIARGHLHRVVIGPRSPRVTMTSVEALASGQVEGEE